MGGHNWFYDAILYIYALSLLFMFSDFVLRNPRAKRLGTGLLAFVWVMQTLYIFAEASQINLFANRTVCCEYGSLFSMFSSLFFFSWLIVTFSLLLIFIVRVDILFIVNLAGFTAAALTFFSNRSLTGAALSWSVRDDLLFIHISLAITGYAAFLFSAIFSAMMLFMYDQLKTKRWTNRLKRLPSLEELQKWTFRFVLIGVPLLLLSLLLGIAWVVLGQEWRLLADWKVLHSVFILFIYAIYLWQRYIGRWDWPRLAAVNLLGCVAVLSNFLLSNLISDFH